MSQEQYDKEIRDQEGARQWANPKHRKKRLEEMEKREMF